MENWKDYIENKFAPKEQFTFATEEHSNSLTATHFLTGNSVRFFWPTNDWLMISDDQFFNDATNGWSGEYKEITFSEKEITALDNYLAPVFENGWLIKDTYFFGKYWKSKVYLKSGTTKKTISYYTANFNLSSILLFPLYEPLANLLGQKKTVRIEAIKNYTQPKKVEIVDMPLLITKILQPA